MTLRTWFAIGFAASLSLSCGGKKEPATPIAKKEPPAAVVEPALVPVSAPADVFAVVRVKDPAKLVDAGMRWASLPFDWRTLLAKELPGADRVIALNAPVDFAAMIDPASGMEPNAFFAVSVGITSIDAALSFFQERGEVVKRSQRLIRIGSDATCTAERSLGPTRARLVCGTDEDAIAALAPYMTRGLPLETLSTADIHARVLAKPFRQRYGMQATLLKTAGVPFILRELSLDHPKFDRALRDALYGGADELLAVFEDLDRLSLDLSMTDDQSSLKASMTLALQGSKSVVSQSIASAAARVGPPPASFWLLPSESSSAAYTGAMDMSRFRGAATGLAALAEGGLDYLELAEAQRKPLVAAFERLLLNEGAVAYAELPGTPPLATGASKSKAAELVEAMRYEIGHLLIAVEGDFSPYQEFLAAATKAMADRKLRARLETLLDMPKGALPTVRERAPRGGKALPRGSKVYEVLIPMDLLIEEPRTAQPLSVVIAAIPDTGRSWIGISADEAGLYEHLAASRASAGTGTLQSREGLAALRSMNAASAGFLTLAEFLNSLDSPLSRLTKEGRAAPVPSATRKSAMLPHRGETPMVYAITPRAQGPEVTMTFDVPREVIQDTAAAIAAGIGQSVRP